MCRKLWPIYSCGHEQIPAQSTRVDSCGNQCPEYLWGWGYYSLETNCGNLRCSTVIRRMFYQGKVKMADWKWNYAAHAGSSYGGGDAGSSSVDVGYGPGNGAGYGGGHRGYGSYGGFTPMWSGPPTTCLLHSAPLLPRLLSYSNAGSGYYQGYNLVPRPMSAPPASCYGPFLLPFSTFGAAGQECSPTIVVRIRR